MLWWWLIWLITFNLIITLAQILYQYFHFQVCQDWGKSLSKYYKIFLESILGVCYGDSGHKMRWQISVFCSEQNIWHYFCYVAAGQKKSIKIPPKERKNQLDFQQDLLLVSLSSMQIFTCGKYRDRSCDISPRCAFSNQVTVGGLKTAHFLFSQQWTSVWAL